MGEEERIVITCAAAVAGRWAGGRRVPVVPQTLAALSARLVR